MIEFIMVISFVQIYKAGGFQPRGNSSPFGEELFLRS
jgi:hypothetical protein